MTGDRETMPWKTAEQFRQWAASRCRERDEACGCLIWKGATTNKGTTPRAAAGGLYWSVRQPAWMLANPSKALQRVDGVMQGAECDPLCIEPTHMVKLSPSAIRKGKPKSLAGRLNMARAALKRSPVRPEDVPEILADSRTAREIAEELGVGREVIESIRNGRSAHVRTVNPFAQLLR
jgi:hypothetical protein